MEILLQHNMNSDGLESLMAFYCAPVIVGIKSANTVNVDSRHLNQLNHMLRETGVSCYVLYESEEKAFCYIYRSQLLKATLEKTLVQDTMKLFGYKTTGIKESLERLQIRYSRYKEGKGEFPHEIGLMLDYPVEDVLEFMKRGGKNCTICGYWKVYCNVDRAKCTFACYDKAREIVISRLVNGDKLASIAREIA